MISLFIALAQLLQSGAATGHSIVWGGTTYVAGVPGASVTFTGQVVVFVGHGLHSADVSIYVYDATETLILPAAARAANPDVVVVYFDTATSGRIVVK